MTHSYPSLPPLRASRKDGVSRFFWSHDGAAVEGWDRWRDSAASGTGWWSVISPDGKKLGGVVFVIGDDVRGATLRKVLGGEGRLRASVETRAAGADQWAGMIAHASGRSGERSIVLVPLAHPVDVGSAPARAGWDSAMALVSAWFAARIGGVVEVAPMDHCWAFPLQGAVHGGGAAALVEGMVLAREGKEEWMISAEAVHAMTAEKSGSQPRVRLQVGPMIVNLTTSEAGELVAQLTMAIDALDQPSNDSSGDSAK